MQGFIKRHGRKKAWVTHWQTSISMARQSNPGTRAGIKTLEGKARQGKARQGKARQGKARQGKARQGKARQERLSGLCRVPIARIYAYTILDNDREEVQGLCRV